MRCWDLYDLYNFNLIIWNRLKSSEFFKIQIKTVYKRDMAENALFSSLADFNS